VPVSAQTFVVLVAGALIGARRAGAGGLTYLAFGVAGVPWFAVTGGATLGYILGFAVAGWIVGRAAEAGLLARRGRALAVMAAAHVVIYVLGAIRARAGARDRRVAAFALGVAPFLIGDTLKVVAAAAIAPALVRTGGLSR
jgi:biotin transport system substrate-specific component